MSGEPPDVERPEPDRFELWLKDWAPMVTAAIGVLVFAGGALLHEHHAAIGQWLAGALQ